MKSRGDRDRAPLHNSTYHFVAEKGWALPTLSVYLDVVIVIIIVEVVVIIIIHIAS
jgi:hypothetical protein